MRLYLYCCQDLLIEDTVLRNLNAGDFYNIQLDNDEYIKVYSKQMAGLMIIDYNTLSQLKHNQINYHQISEDSILCEIRPFISDFMYQQQYTILNTNLKLIPTINGTYIFLNDCYQGIVNQNITNPHFEKLGDDKNAIGILSFDSEEKTTILFDSERIIFCGKYIDKQIFKNQIQVYLHNPNVFNIGQLLKVDLNTHKTEYMSVADRGEEIKLISNEFNITYFLEAIKCGRYKYAYNKLSYELKSAISLQTLRLYFTTYDAYFYLEDEDAYITINNGKIVGVYHFDIKNNTIFNIY